MKERHAQIIDWKPINNYPRGKFALEFEVSVFDENFIRNLINLEVSKIQKRLQKGVTEQN